MMGQRAAPVLVARPTPAKRKGAVVSAGGPVPIGANSDSQG